MNNKKTLFLIPLFLLVSLLSSCEVIGDIFKSGVYVGIFIVVLVIIGIVWLFGRMGRK